MEEKSITKTFEKEEWYVALVEECQAIITEAVFTSRWVLVEGNHKLGETIRENDNVKKLTSDKKYTKELTSLLKDLALKIKMSERSLWYALAIYDKYPDKDKLPEGKNITMNKLITKYLPHPKEERIEIPLPQGEFDVIYADPPWAYDFSETMSRQIENQYATMTVQEISALKVPTADNSVLFLWATAPKIREALEVMLSWGFEYKTHMIWDKEIIGMGYWARGQHELLLIGVKGEYSVPVPEVRESSVYRERRGEHSKKPNHYYELIEKLCPNGKYLELFARQKFNDKWTIWGLEADNNDNK